jgi:outer membrane protein OmpA-like peptidoglycan-associated protein
MLMNNGKYEEARKWLSISTEEKPNDERPKNYLNSIESIHRFFSDSLSYKISNLPVNGVGNDFSPVFFHNGIVFTSSTKTRISGQRHSWTGESFTRLVFYDMAQQRTQDFATEIKSRYNNGPSSFTSSGEMYNTINVLKVENHRKDLYKLNIIHAVNNGKNWSKREDFPFNTSSYNTAHPAVSADGNEMYFSSDMPGWTVPRNLGSDINTPGNEIFPFIHSDGTLYFASNGHEGLGGLDILISRKNENGWERPVAFGYPINSRSDDFSFVMNEAKTSGYFSSNRPGGKGGDDVYQFDFTPSTLHVKVTNEKTETIGNASLVLIEKKTGKRASVTADEHGGYNFQVSACHEYELIASADAYHENITTVRSSCARVSKDLVPVILLAPRLKFTVLNKYSAEKIEQVRLRVIDSHTNEVLSEGLADAMQLAVKPCHEYMMVSVKEGLPETWTHFKTACKVKDEVVTIVMGVPPADPSLLAGTVYEQGTDMTLDSVTMIISDKANKPIAAITTAAGGEFAITGFKNADKLTFFKNGYFSVTKVITGEGKKEMRIEMPKLALDKIIQLDGIFYDVGKFDIRADAARVLDNVVKVMQENQSLEIELSAHTDARGNDQSNLSLSDKRAKAAAAYIMSKGINESRVKGKGYGETVLKNNCGNGVKCTEQEHQENRRTEVKIVGY